MEHIYDTWLQQRWKAEILVNNPKIRNIEMSTIRNERLVEQVIYVNLEWSFFFGDNLFDFVISTTKNCPYKEFTSDVIDISDVFFTTIWIRSIFNIFFSLFFRKISFLLSFC